MTQEEKQVSKEVLAQLKEDEKKKIGHGLKEIEKEIMSQHKVKDQQRVHELKTLLTEAVGYLADRFDQGVDIEASVPEEPTAEATSDDEEKKKPTREEQERAVARQAVLGGVQAMKRFKRSDKPVLRLAKPTPEEKQEEKPSLKVKKKQKPQAG